MATRFGGVSPAHSYAAKMRWLVACLVAVIVALAVGVVVIAKKGSATQDAPAVVENQTTQPKPASSTIEVLYSVARIEVGTPLEAHMFMPQSVEADKAPIGVIKARDIETIRGKFSARLIEPNSPVLLDAVTINRPVSPLVIPPGHRAVTIRVDERTSVDGLAKPNSRVDVIWTYQHNGKTKVATVVHFCKILTAGGVTAQNQGDGQKPKSNTATLLVTERDAKKIELAQTLGKLSLVLVGDQEPGARETAPESVSLEDIIGRTAERDQVEEEPINFQGIMYTTDPKTGKQMRYTLRNERWVQDNSH